MCFKIFALETKKALNFKKNAIFHLHFLFFLSKLYFTSKPFVLQVTMTVNSFPPYGNIVPRSQWAFTCSKLTIETLEQGVKYVQSY